VVDDIDTLPEGGAPVGHDRVTRIASIVLIMLAALAWADVLRTGIAMNDDMAMEGMSHGTSDALAFVAGWAVMMTAMMLPSALPMIMLFSAVQPKASVPIRRAGAVGLFTGMYLAMWAASGIPVYVAMRRLDTIGEETASVLVAVVLIVAGAYQLSPLKQACLRQCRTPLGFFLGHWRAGLAGSVRIAWAHAAYCLGCCWALMVVLVAAGAMGLAWVVLIAAVVGAEKLAPRGEWIARLAGAALIGLGLAVALRPELATVLHGRNMM
jgi:predicted metal-binding membrane protein